MYIGIGIGISVLEMAISYITWKIYKLEALKKKMLYFIIVIMTLVTGYLNISLMNSEFNYYYIANVSIVYLLTLAVSIIDYEKKLIPNTLLSAALAARVITLVVEGVNYPDEIVSLIIRSLIGLGLGLLVMLFISIVTKKGIGYGDVKLFAVIGFCVGFIDLYSILFYSVLAAAVVSIYLLLVKKSDRKTKLAFGPFIYIGCCIVYVLTVM